MSRGYRRAKSKAHKADTVDLGLARIMNGSPGAAETADKSEPGELPAPLPSVAADPESLEYTQLAEKNAWAELAMLCEGRLPAGAPPEEAVRLIEPRLWWIQSQLMLGTVPASILAAPLDGASRLLMEACLKEPQEGLERLKPLAAKLLQEMSAVLRRNGDISLALSFLERAYRLDSSYRNCLLDFVRTALKLEQSDLGNSSAQRAVLRDHLECLGRELEPCGPPVVQNAAQQIDSGVAQSFAASGLYKVRRYIVSLAVALVIVVLGLIWLGVGQLFLNNKARSWRELWSRPAGPNFAVIGFSRSASPLGPELERTSNLSHLDTLFYDLQRPRPVFKGSGFASGSQPAAPVSSKEKVNTTSPLEGPDMAAKNADHQAPLPSGPTVEASEDPLALAGRVASVPSFEDFRHAKLYVILVATRVMSEPSLRGETLTRLEPGDHVLVDGKHGYWLVIRSKQGKRGYLLAQDAVLEKEW